MSEDVEHIKGLFFFEKETAQSVSAAKMSQDIKYAADREEAEREISIDIY